jgi:chemotaxis signal transduction protein
MEQEKSFCLFHGDAGPMAVSVESVAAVLETEFLVPLVWSPPQVVGLCPYHREVVPVISLGPIESGPGADRENEVDSHPAAGTVTSAAKDGGEENTRCVVLILRTEHDAWGLRTDHRGTFISRECPDFHPPRLDEHGSTFVGVIVREDTRYSILDAEATWFGLRSAVARWYELINEPSFHSALRIGEKTREAGAETTG